MKNEVELYREKVFKAKKKYHEDLSRLPYEEKVKILKRMWKIAREIKNSTSL